jgi:hypothetical protein
MATTLAPTQSCFSSFGKLKDKVNEALEQGKLEGFTDIQTGDMIRQALLQVGFTRMTVTRYLPPSANISNMLVKNFTRKVLGAEEYQKN